MEFGVNIKQLIKEEANNAIDEYNNRPEVKTIFEKLIIGYTHADNPLYHDLHIRNLCDHPKSIFRPGQTIIVYFIPYGQKISDNNKFGELPTEEWVTADRESSLLTALINGAVRRALDTIGRVTSGTNTPADWRQDVFRPEWDHRIPAYLAGLGDFGTNGSFITKKGFAGRLGSVITDGLLTASNPTGATDFKTFYEHFTEKNEICRKDSLCPIGAIRNGKINHSKCQEHCKQIYDYAPSPTICGKCFY